MATKSVPPNTPPNVPPEIIEPDVFTSPSTLNPEIVDEPDRELGLGHGTEALGPSDSSDSGSDIHGAPGWSREVGIRGLETGTTSDPEESAAGFTAGPDLGDANLDSDTDASGTGEHATAGRDTVISDGQDIDTDRIESIDDIINTELDTDVGGDDELPPRHKRH